MLKKTTCEIEKEINELFDLELENQLDFADKEVMIFGTGTRAKEVCDVLEKNHINVKRILNRAGTFTSAFEDDVEVLTPNDPQISKYEKENAIVIMGIFNPYADEFGLIDELRRFGYVNILSYLEIFYFLKNQLSDGMWLTQREFYFEHKKEIIEAAKLFEDELSYNIFAAILKFKLTGSYNKELLEPKGEQYFPNDIDFYNKVLTCFVDCGAYDGDTINQLLNQYKGVVETVIAFEPDMKSYEKLLDSTKNIDNLKLITLPCGVWDNNTVLNFNSGLESSSFIGDQGISLVSAVKIDSVLKNIDVSVIKMDIEGAEYNALIGSEMTIKKYKPALAICLYHRPEDFYKIPLLIKSINEEYKLSIRLHCHCLFELVLYAK
jgi:FkbM family methyltransferase